MTDSISILEGLRDGIGRHIHTGAELESEAIEYIVAVLDLAIEEIRCERATPEALAARARQRLDVPMHTISLAEIVKRVLAAAASGKVVVFPKPYRPTPFDRAQLGRRVAELGGACPPDLKGRLEARETKLDGVWPPHDGGDAA